MATSQQSCDRMKMAQVNDCTIRVLLTDANYIQLFTHKNKTGTNTARTTAHDRVSCSSCSWSRSQPWLGPVVPDAPPPTLLHEQGRGGRCQLPIICERGPVQPRVVRRLEHRPLRVGEAGVPPLRPRLARAVLRVKFVPPA